MAGVRLNENADSPEVLLQRVQAYASEWRTRQRSTEPADRPRAEAALCGLYADARLAAPQVMWVSSPRAGAHAYHLARRARRPIRGHHTRGDIGSGANRDFNALAEPFDLSPEWLRSLRQRIRTLLPREVAGEALTGDLFDGANRVMALLVAALEMAMGDPLPLETPAPSLSHEEIERFGRASLGDDWERYTAEVGGSLLSELLEQAVARTVADLLDPAASLRPILQAIQPGQFDALAPMYGLVLDVLPLPTWRRWERRPREMRLRRPMEIAASAGPWWALEGLVIVSERPLVLKTDPRGRPHAETGPAIAYPDGMTVWAWHAVAVPEWVVTQPDRIDVAAIARERNIEVRRVLTERAGWQRIASEGGARLVQEDHVGRLWETRQPIDREPSWGARARFVEVENSTPERYGGGKLYFIRVPPEMRTARQAVAWTFELGEVEYSPTAET